VAVLDQILDLVHKPGACQRHEPEGEQVQEGAEVSAPGEDGRNNSAEVRAEGGG
jgi:hypothetical protein